MTPGNVLLLHMLICNTANGENKHNAMVPYQAEDQKLHYFCGGDQPRLVIRWHHVLHVRNPSDPSLILALPFLHRSKDSSFVRTAPFGVNGSPFSLPLSRLRRIDQPCHYPPFALTGHEGLESLSPFVIARCGVSSSWYRSYRRFRWRLAKVGGCRR